jgi:hypothetical protein
MAWARRSLVRAPPGGGARPDTRRHASSGHPRCRERATCVPDRGRCERPDGRRGHSSVPGYGGRSPGVRDSRADRIRAAKKNWSCVTTRRLGALAARALSLSVAGFGLGRLTMLGLSPRRLPASDFPLAFRLLAVALVPRPRLVVASASFAQADPRTRSAPSGSTAVLSLNVVGAHGRLNLPREKLGEDVSASSSGAIQTRTRR